MQKVEVLSSDLIPLIKETIASNQPLKLLVTGFSMWPIYRHKETIVTLAPINTLKPYDVILYVNHQKKLILHRVNKLSQPLVVCGDALRNNELVNRTQVLAKVIKVERLGKEQNTTDRFYRLKVRLWVILKPLRPLLLKIFRKGKNHESSL